MQVSYIVLSVGIIFVQLLTSTVSLTLYGSSQSVIDSSFLVLDSLSRAFGLHFEGFSLCGGVGEVPGGAVGRVVGIILLHVSFSYT